LPARVAAVPRPAQPAAQLAEDFPSIAALARPAAMRSFDGACGAGGQRMQGQ